MMGTEASRFLESLESSEGIHRYLPTVSGAIYPIHPMPAADTEIPSSAEPWTKNIAPGSSFSMKASARSVRSRSPSSIEGPSCATLVS